MSRLILQIALRAKKLKLNWLSLHYLLATSWSPVSQKLELVIGPTDSIIIILITKWLWNVNLFIYFFNKKKRQNEENVTPTSFIATLFIILFNDDSIISKGWRFEAIILSLFIIAISDLSSNYWIKIFANMNDECQELFRTSQIY